MIYNKNVFNLNFTIILSLGKKRRLEKLFVKRNFIYLEINSINLNLNFTISELSVIIENSSSDKLSFKFFSEFSSIMPEDTSTKHNGGKREHHQF